MKKRTTKRSAEKIGARDIHTLSSWFYLMLAELSPASRRRLLDLPASELRKIGRGLRAKARSRARAA